MNKEKTLERKQIKKDVITRINEGIPKQQILEELSQSYKDKVSIVKQLELTPSKLMKYKFRMFNYMLAGLLLAAMILDVIIIVHSELGTYLVMDIFFGLSVVLDVIFLIGVLLYRIESYSWIASRAIVSLITITISMYYYTIAEIDKLVFVSLALIAIFFVLGLLLGVKLCPSRVPKIIEVDIDGSEKINKTVYVFPD